MQGLLRRLGWIGTAALVVATGCGGNSKDGTGSNQGSEDAGSDASVQPEAGVGSSDMDSGSSLNHEPPPPPFMTGLDGGTKLVDLSSDDFAKVCSDLNTYFQMQFSPGALKPFLCNLEGVVTALEASGLGGGGGGGGGGAMGLRAACITARSNCLQGPADAAADQLGFNGFDFHCPAPNQTCTATVNDLESCTNDLTALKARLGRNVPQCEDLSLTTGLALALGLGNVQLPGSCDRVNRCNAPANTPPAAN